MKSKWINADKKSPKKPGSYLVDVSTLFEPVIRQFDKKWISYEKVEHWMPIPKTPRNRKKVVVPNEDAIEKLKYLTDEEFMRANRGIREYLITGSIPTDLSEKETLLVLDIVSVSYDAGSLPIDTQDRYDASLFAHIAYLYAMKAKEKNYELWQAYKEKMFL